MLPKFQIPYWETRIYEIIPGLLTWLTFLIPIVFIFFIPKLVAYLIILFDLYWFFRSLNVSRHLIIAYQKLKKNSKIDWLVELKKSHFDYGKIYHVIVIPAYNESKEVLETSILALVKVNYDLSKVWLVLTIEARGGGKIREVAEDLKVEYSKYFGKFLLYIHPDGIAGEAKAKGANITYAAKNVEQELIKNNIAFEDVLISSLDSDSAVSPQLLANFTYTFLSTNNHHKKIFQFMPMYHNNFWDAPGVSRIIATGAGFWTMIESTRKERFRSFAVYGMSWKNLKEADYWDVTSIIEDGMQYWRNIFAQKDKVGLVEPIYSPVYMDAVLDNTWWKTMIAQYKQLRRWSWGASDLSYILPRFRRMKCFSLKEKFLYVSRLIENHWSWATAPLILLFAGQIPLINRQFAQTVLGSNVPVVTSWILTITLSGMLVSIIISTLLLPDRKHFPRRYGPFLSHFYHILPAILVPFITIIYGAIPALHSQTQLMLGKKMEKFVVTVKEEKTNRIYKKLACLFSRSLDYIEIKMKSDVVIITINDYYITRYIFLNFLFVYLILILKQ